MKMTCIAVVLVCLFAAVARSQDTKDRSAYGGVTTATATAPAPIPFPIGGYADGAAISALPCPRNYLFSCQPSLQPAPCANYGSVGAYSENHPVYALPVPQYVKGYQTY